MIKSLPVVRPNQSSSSHSMMRTAGPFPSRSGHLLAGVLISGEDDPIFNNS